MLLVWFVILWSNFVVIAELISAFKIDMICNFKGTSARTIGNEQSRKQKKTFICETDTIYAFQLKSLPETHVLVLNLKSNASR